PSPLLPRRADAPTDAAAAHDYPALASAWAHRSAPLPGDRTMALRCPMPRPCVTFGAAIRSLDGRGVPVCLGGPPGGWEALVAVPRRTAGPAGRAARPERSDWAAG